MPNTLTVTYAASYVEAYGTGDTSAELELWRAILRQAGEDLLSPNERIRADAEDFFEGPDLLDVLDLAGIDHDLAPAVRERALASCQQPRWSRRRHQVVFRGESGSVEEWSRVTGLSIHTLHHRLRNGWSVARALSTPGRH